MKRKKSDKSSIEELRKLVSGSIRSTEEYKRSTEEFKNKVDGWLAENEKQKVENEKWKKEWTKRWGEISNKLGHLVEDFIIPNLPSIAEQFIGRRPLAIYARISKALNGESAEFDGLADCGKIMIVTEIKSSIYASDVDKFLDETLPDFRKFFPEYARKKIFPMLASLNVESSVIKYATRRRLPVMALKGDKMVIVNSLSLEKILR